MDTVKLMWLSDSPFVPTGYRNQSINLMNNLAKKGFDIHYLANNFRIPDVPFENNFKEGQLSKDHILPGSKLIDDMTFDFNIYWMWEKNYFQERMVKMVRDIKPDVHGILLDLFMVYPFYLTEWDLAPAKTAFWFPSDGGGGLPIGCQEIIRKVNLPIAMSRFAQFQTLKYHNLKTDYIPHAINEKQFFRLPDDKRYELKGRWGLRDKFVVGAVYRNQGRKMPDGMFYSFAKFSKSHPDAVMLCHTDPYDPAAPFNTPFLLQQLGITNKVIFTGMNLNKGFTDSQMNEVYNLMDVQISSTSGEGYGLCTVEGFAAEVPMIITDYTSSKELVEDNGKSGELVPLAAEIMGNWQVKRAIFDPIFGSDALEKLYNNEDLISKYGKMGRKKVETEYNWENVTQKWDQKLKELLKK